MYLLMKRRQRRQGIIDGQAVGGSTELHGRWGQMESTKWMKNLD
jgi:hypothetical protein